MEEQNNFLTENQEQNKPKNQDKFLKILCYLTFIWSGFGIFTNLLLSLFFENYKLLIPEMNFPQEYKDLKQMLLLMMSAGRIYFFISLLLNISSFYGAYLMLKMKKQGFHFYTIAQIIMLMLPLIFLKGIPFSFMEFFTTATFIAFYAIHTREMRKA
jgi:hypothetical protein